MTVHNNISTEEINKKILETAALILDYEEDYALKYDDKTISYLEFIVMDSCWDIIEDPSYAEDEEVPDMDDLTEVRNWLRHRAEVAWEQYIPEND